MADQTAADTRDAARDVVARSINSFLGVAGVVQDWSQGGFEVVAVNDIFHRIMCPREVIVGRSCRLLESTSRTEMPASDRIAIREANAFGLPIQRMFYTRRTSKPYDKFAKMINMQTCIMGPHRFVFGFLCEGKIRNAEVWTKEPVEHWWKPLQIWLEQEVAKHFDRPDFRPRWVTAVDAAKWAVALESAPLPGVRVLQKQQLETCIAELMAGLPYPVLVCDPLLPECPVISLNQAARALTGWEHAGPGVASADALYLDGKDVQAAGSYHLNYGSYRSSGSEVTERLAVRAAHANGRFCVAAFRPMNEFPGERPLSMSLQGVTVAQGCEGSACGDTVWYLFAFLKDGGQVDFQEETCALRTVLSSLLSDPGPSGELSAPETADAGNLPYGGAVTLLQVPVFHAAAHDVVGEELGVGTTNTEDVRAIFSSEQQYDGLRCCSSDRSRRAASDVASSDQQFSVSLCGRALF